MKISKKQLKDLISEEVEKVSAEKDNMDALLEGYANGYDADETSIPKEALVDLLSVMEEARIPLAAFHAFMENLSEDMIVPLLKEVVEPQE